MENLTTRFLVATLLLFLLVFCLTRGVVLLVIYDRLKTPAARRKRRKKQTPWQWFTYARYRDIVTRPVLIYYYGTIIYFLVAILVFVIMGGFEASERTFSLCFSAMHLISALPGAIMVVGLCFTKEKTTTAVIKPIFDRLDKQYEKRQRKKELRKQDKK